MKQQDSLQANAHSGAFDVTEVKLAIRRIFIRLPHVESALSRMSELASHQCEDMEPEHLLITGQAGVGKSLVLKKFRDSQRPIEHPHFREIPVVYTEVPAACSIKKLAGEMLKSMGSPFWNRGTEADRTHQLLTLLKECKVRLVMLDEVNHLVDRGKSATHYAVGDWIKQLTDKAGISFVLAGTPMARVLLVTNAQIRSRFGEEIAIEPLSLASAQEALIFKKTLKAFQSLLGTLDCVDLAGQEMLRRMAYACGGRLRSLVDLLVRSVELAAVSKPQALTMSALEGAFSQVIYSKAPKERNPFNEAFNGQPLTAPAEPFGPERR
jgi:Cdc6-like AAA superfamily ATPase